MATFGPLPGPRKSRPRALFTAWTRGPRSHERIIKIIRVIRFIKIIALICIIRIIRAISQDLISPGRARKPLRAPGRQRPKNAHFTKGLQKELATFGPWPGRRKSGPRPLLTAWTACKHNIAQRSAASVADVRADSDRRRTAMPIASDILSGFGLAVGTAPAPAPVLARAPAPVAIPAPAPPVPAESSATGRRAAGGDARSV